jgi:outer membrane receptor protein involved in Fe transport
VADFCTAALTNGAYRGRIDTVNIALFGEVTVPLTERLDWIGGLRLSHERKEFEGTFRGRNGAVPISRKTVTKITRSPPAGRGSPTRSPTT